MLGLPSWSLSQSLEHLLILLYLLSLILIIIINNDYYCIKLLFFADTGFGTYFLNFTFVALIVILLGVNIVMYARIQSLEKMASSKTVPKQREEKQDPTMNFESVAKRLDLIKYWYDRFLKLKTFQQLMYRLVPFIIEPKVLKLTHTHTHTHTHTFLLLLHNITIIYLQDTNSITLFNANDSWTFSYKPFFLYHFHHTLIKSKFRSLF